MLFAVQGHEFFSCGSFAHHNLATVQQVVVERVKRLAELQHDVVGHVHDVVDGAHPRQLQPPGHPERGRANFKIPQVARCVPRAVLAVQHLHGDVIRDLCVRFLRHAGLRHPQLQTVVRSELSGNPNGTETVRPVRRDADLVDPVLADELCDVRSGLDFLEQPELVGSGSETQLRFGAKHAARNHVSEPTFLH